VVVGVAVGVGAVILAGVSTFVYRRVRGTGAEDKPVLKRRVEVTGTEFKHVQFVALKI
jgi:hypothetical protein